MPRKTIDFSLKQQKSIPYPYLKKKNYYKAIYIYNYIYTFVIANQGFYTYCPK